MTTIAAIHVPGRGSWVGCDQMLTSGMMKMGPVPKWILGPNGWACAAAGHYHMLTVMEEEATRLFKGLKDARQFVKRLKIVLREHDYQPTTDGSGPLMWGENTVLLAHPTGIWEFDTTLSTYRVPDNKLWACGSGAMYALGAGHALLQEGHGGGPEGLVETAIKTAAHYDNGTGFEPIIHALLLEDLSKEPAPPKKSRARAKKNAASA